MTQLLLAGIELSKNSEVGHLVGIIYLDLAKAFNAVPLQRLLKKVKMCFIHGKIMKWV